MLHIYTKRYLLIELNHIFWPRKAAKTTGLSCDMTVSTLSTVGSASSKFLEMLLVELKFRCTFFIELKAELAKFFGQNWCATIKYA